MLLYAFSLEKPLRFVVRIFLFSYFMGFCETLRLILLQRRGLHESS